MFCLPARGAEEEEKRKRRERGCEDRQLVFPSWSEADFTSSRQLSGIQVSLVCITSQLSSDLNWLEGQGDSLKPSTPSVVKGLMNLS